jgi:hypothetical protein
LRSLRQGITMIDPRKALALLNQPNFDRIRQNEQFVELVTQLGGR